MENIRKPVRYISFLLSLILLTFLGSGLYHVYKQLPVKKKFPVPTVEVIEIKTVPTRIWSNYSGRLQPVETVDIQPLVGGKIDHILFTDGDYVEKGTTLFIIDPRPLKAAMDWANSELAKALSVDKLSEAELSRQKRLVEDKFVSATQYDSTLRQHQISSENVRQANAAYKQAKLEYENAYIKAPISGKIGRAELTVGNTVGAGPNAPVLTRIISNEKYYAEFEIDELTYINLLKHTDDPKHIPIEVDVPNLGGMNIESSISSFNNRIDDKNGTIRTRAIVHNTNNKLISGMFININLGTPETEKNILVPQNAIKTDLARKFVYIIDEENIARYQQVEVGAYYDKYRIIESGLAPGDHVVVNGTLHIRKNKMVKPKKISIFEDTPKVSDTGPATTLSLRTQTKVFNK